MGVEIMEDIHKKEIANYFDEDSAYWSKVYKETDDTRGFISYEMLERKRILLDLFHKILARSDSYILDCGCGTSVLLPELIDYGSGLYGIDISFNQLVFAKENLKNKISSDKIHKISLILSDIEILPFKNGYFDVIFCVGVLQYLLNDKFAVKELSRITKSGGYVFITLPNLFKLNSIMDPYYLKRGVKFLRVKLFGKKNKKNNSNIDTEFSDNTNFLNRRYYYGQLKSLFVASGLEIIASKSVSFGTFKFLGRDLFCRNTSIKISNFLRKMSEKKCFFMLNFFANRWIFCLRKI